jgi:hypothetical protein
MPSNAIHTRSADPLRIAKQAGIGDAGTSEEGESSTGSRIAGPGDRGPNLSKGILADATVMVLSLTLKPS